MRDRCHVTNKTKFSDLGAAQHAILAFKGNYWDSVTHKRRKRRCGKSGLKRAYYCEHCSGYHLTSQESYSETATYEKRAKKYRRIPQSIWNRKRI